MSERDRRDDTPAVSRRSFLGQASCAAVGSTALMSTALDLGMLNALASTSGDYRALVCVFLSGGIDSYNVLVPTGDAEYAEYAAVRDDLALPQASLLPITPATPDGRSYGLHAGMPELRSLFASGRAALVANVGTLVEPTTLAQFRDRSVTLPLGLFSHSDQAMHWQSSIPDARAASGWAGRMEDILGSLNSNTNISMNISLSGTNVFQSGGQSAPYTIGTNGSRGLRDYGGTSTAARARTDAVDGLLGMTYQHLFEQTYADAMRGALDAHRDFGSAVEGVSLTTPFSQTRLSERLRMVARTIGARDALGMRRQTFFVEFGGWDHHDEVLVSQQQMLPVLSAALAEFDAALGELGVRDQVTTFTASDFGRTLTSNGRGSDHAWGGNHIVTGGCVRGGDLYGSYPSLYPGNELDTGRGRLIPTTSVDEYVAELALWFGVPRTDLELVVPNLRRFYDPGASAPPIGFLASPSSAPTPTARSGSPRIRRPRTAAPRTRSPRRF